MIGRVAVVGVLCALITATPAVSSAQTGAVPVFARHLDGDAAIVVRVDPGEFERLFKFAMSHAGSPARRALVLASVAASAALSESPLSTQGWRALGLDPSSPLLIAIAPPQDKAATGRPAYWRIRAVARIADWSRARARLRRLSALSGAIYDVAAGDQASAIARLLGADRPRAMQSRLSKRVVLVADVPVRDGRAFVHRSGDALIIDVLARGVSGAMPRWQTSGKRLLRLLDRPTQTIAPRLERGAAAAVNSRGVALWADPDRVIAMALAAERDGLITRPGVLRDDRARRVDCENFRQLAREGPFSDISLSIRVAPGQLTAAVTWGLRPSHGLAGSLASADDRLLDIGGVSAHVKAVVRTRRPGALRDLPRPRAFRGDAIYLDRAVARCGPGATAIAWPIGWPLIAGMWLDQVASIHADAALMIDSTRNAALAIQRFSLDPRRVVGALEASFDARARRTLTELGTLVYGEPQRRTTPRAHTRWGSGPLRLYAWDADDAFVLGNARGAASLDWYLAEPRPARPADVAMLGEFAIELGAVVDASTPMYSELSALRSYAGRLLGTLTGALRLELTRLRLDVRLDIPQDSTKP